MSFATIRDEDGDTISVEVADDASQYVIVESKSGVDWTVVTLTKAEAMLLAKMLQNAVWEVTQNEHV
jgi:hypothetical protein